MKSNWSQSPQIGAFLQTDQIQRQQCWQRKGVSIPSNRGIPSDRSLSDALTGKGIVSIPSNRGIPSDLIYSKTVGALTSVSIPSNRGIPSDQHVIDYDGPHEPGLNPLKSGHSFRPIKQSLRGSKLKSLNPLKSGHSFRLNLIELLDYAYEGLNPLKSGHSFRRRKQS